MRERIRRQGACVPSGIKRSNTGTESTRGSETVQTTRTTEPTSPAPLTPYLSFLSCQSPIFVVYLSQLFNIDLVIDPFPCQGSLTSLCTSVPLKALLHLPSASSMSKSKAFSQKLVPNMWRASIDVPDDFETDLLHVSTFLLRVRNSCKDIVVLLLVIGDDELAKNMFLVCDPA